MKEKIQKLINGTKKKQDTKIIFANNTMNNTKY